MNVREFCKLVYKEDTPVKIKLDYMQDVVTQLDIYNPLQMEAYGKFKIEFVRALDGDSYEIAIAYTPATPIIEN